jgi:hypothetical protein
MPLGVGKCLSGPGQHFMRWASDDGIAKLPRNGSESASQSDLQVIANRVFYEFAPFWYMAQTWHCKKNKTEDSQNVFVLKGPLSSKEVSHSHGAAACAKLSPSIPIDIQPLHL